MIDYAQHIHDGRIMLCDHVVTTISPIRSKCHLLVLA